MFSINYIFKTILFTNAVSNTFVIFMKYTCFIFQNLKYFHSKSRSCFDGLLYATLFDYTSISISDYSITTSTGYKLFMKLCC